MIASFCSCSSYPHHDNLLTRVVWIKEKIYMNIPIFFNYLWKGKYWGKFFYWLTLSSLDEALLLWQGRMKLLCLCQRSEIQFTHQLRSMIKVLICLGLYIPLISFRAYFGFSRLQCMLGWPCDNALWDKLHCYHIPFCMFWFTLSLCILYLLLLQVPPHAICTRLAIWHFVAFPYAKSIICISHPYTNDESPTLSHWSSEHWNQIHISCQSVEIYS